MEEYFDTYTRDGEFLGVKPKSFCHSKNADCYHKAVCAFLINKKGELLIQKRASTKKNQPNKWASTSAGHVDAGEDVFKAIQRETFEEIGLNLSASEFVLEKVFTLDDSLEFMHLFFAKSDAKLSEIVIQKEEVSEVKWISIKELERLMFSDDFVLIEDEFKFEVLNILKRYQEEI